MQRTCASAVLLLMTCVFSMCQIYASNGDSEVPGFFEGARSRDLVQPLSEEEQPSVHPWSWLKWCAPPCSSLAYLRLRSQTSLAQAYAPATICAPAGASPKWISVPRSTS